MTEHYLEIYKGVYEAGELKIDRIDREDEEGIKEKLRKEISNSKNIVIKAEKFK